MRPTIFRGPLPATILAVALAASGCSTTNPDVVSRRDAQQTQTVRNATVESVRMVTIDGNQSGVGAVAGAVAGGVAGASIGGHREAIVGGVLLGLAGGLVGNAIERTSTREAGYELILRFQDGTRAAVVQGQGAQDLRAGDTVRVIGTGGRLRVSR